jgi:hypothetical protein
MSFQPMKNWKLHARLMNWCINNTETMNFVKVIDVFTFI